MMYFIEYVKQVKSWITEVKRYSGGKDVKSEKQLSNAH